MKKIFSVVWLILGSLIWNQCPVQVSHACSDGPEGEGTRLSFLDPALSGLGERAPFYYTEDFYYTDKADPERKDLDKNIDEWMAYLGAEVKRKDLYNALYETSAKDFLYILRKGLKQEHTFFQKIRGNKLLLDYWTLARRSEFVATAINAPWDNAGYGEASTEQETIDLPLAIKQLKAAWNQALAGSTDAFLKERNAYQAVVWNRYAEDFNGVIQVYDTYLIKSKSILRPWALMHKAHALFRKQKLIAANLALIDVYQSCESRKLRCMQGFDFSLKEKTQALLKSDQDKATALAMIAARNPGPALPAIQALWQNTAHQEADVLLLLTREVNKLESWLFTRSVAGFESSLKSWQEGEEYPEEIRKEWVKNPATVKNQLKDLAYLREFRTWMEKVWPGTTGRKADLMALYIGHLFTVEGKPAEAKEWFRKVKNVTPGITQQLKLEELLLLPYLKPLQNAATQAELAQMLEGWYKPHTLPPTNYKTGSLEAYYAYHFFKAGNIPLSALFSNLLAYQWLNEYTGTEYYYAIRFLDRHANVEVMDELIAMVKNPGSAPLVQWLMQQGQYIKQLNESESKYYWKAYSNQPGVNQLLELRGTLALRAGNTAEALKSWQQVPADFWDSAHEFKLWLDRDLFVDADHWPWEGIPEGFYNKTKVAEKLLALESAYANAKGREKAELAWQLGNAWYNMSYYGHSWMMLSYGNHVDEQEDGSYFNFHPNAQKISELYYRCAKAREYYAACLNAKPNAELGARAQYMQVLIEELLKLTATQEWDTPAPKKELSPYAQWGKQYKNTKVYQERINTCPELAEFFNRKR